MLDSDFELFVKRLGRDHHVKVCKVEYVMSHKFKVYFVKRRGFTQEFSNALDDLMHALEFLGAQVMYYSPCLFVDIRYMS